MSAPRQAEAEQIEVAPAVIFALLVIIPFLNFEFTFYRTTFKFFVFQCAVTVLWGYLAWQWRGGRVRWAEWPAWWLVAPLGAWVAWGAVAQAWSVLPPMGWHWVVQDAYGLLGAVGVALLLRGERLRWLFLRACFAVVAVMAVLMIVFYGQPHSGFYGDADVLGSEVGAAFLLVPTLVAGALLLGRLERPVDVERSWARVLLLSGLLVLALAAGLRADSAAWAYGLGAGVAVSSVLVRRLRPVGVVLALVVVGLCVAREWRIDARAEGPIRDPATREAALAREALLDEAEWDLALGRGAGRALWGSGLGTFSLVFDVHRPMETYASSYADRIEGHARRAASEMLFERGLVGAAIAVAVGLASLAAGVLAFRRARTEGDAALGMGLGAGVLAMGVAGCLSHGMVSFGARIVFWLGAGLLGALSVRTARPAGLSWSPEEALGRRGRPKGLGRLRGLVAVGGVAVLVLVWLATALQPLRGSLALRDGRSELDTTQALGAQRANAQQMLIGLRQRAERMAEDLAARPEPPADLRRQAERAQEAVERAEQQLELVTGDYAESIRLSRRALERAARLSLDGRVWVNTEISLVMVELAAREPQAALERYRDLAARVGSSFALDLLGANCYIALDRPAEAHKLYRRYSRRNPLAASCALFHTNTHLYERWLALIDGERRKPEPDPAWRAWAWDYAEACARGLAVLPEHHGLLMSAGEIFYRLGRDAASYDHQMAAATIIRLHLGDPQRRRRYGPRMIANLLLDLANTCVHWDKPTALAAVNRIGAGELGLDPTLPMYRDIFERVGRIRAFLDPGGVREAYARLRATRQQRQPPTPLPGPRPGTETAPAPATATPRGPSVPVPPPPPGTALRP
ncbi:MAG: hypothetical protein ACODAJ_01700 [Planctomycetota bacterium]